MIRMPEGKPHDKLFNRRLMAYGGLIFSVIWSQEVLLIWAVLVAFGKSPDASVIIALLGVPGSIAGLGFWQYLKAAKKDDEQ